mgnify:CR=1 FL=1
MSDGHHEIDYESEFHYGQSLHQTHSPGDDNSVESAIGRDELPTIEDLDINSNVKLIRQTQKNDTWRLRNSEMQVGKDIEAKTTMSHGCQIKSCLIQPPKLNAGAIGLEPMIPRPKRGVLPT